MTKKQKNSRLDVVLVERGYFASREQAQRAIMAGEVRVGDAVIDKSSAKIKPDADVFVRKRSPYVGRGGLKLEGALDHFQIAVQGLTALDIGASARGRSREAKCALPQPHRQPGANRSLRHRRFLYLANFDLAECL